MQGGRRKRNLRMAARRAGVIIGVGVATTVALLGVPGNASATAIGVEGSSDCAGPDAWGTTWRISVTSASADETWRLNAPVGDAGFRSIAEPVVVEQVYAMDERIAQLDVTITLVDAETTLSTSASMDWPTVCTSAPAPPVASGAVDPGDSTGDPTDDQAALTMTAPIDIGGPDPGTESTPATSARTRSIAARRGAECLAGRERAPGDRIDQQHPRRHRHGVRGRRRPAAPSGGRPDAGAGGRRRPATRAATALHVFFSTSQTIRASPLEATMSNDRAPSASRNGGTSRIPGVASEVITPSACSMGGLLAAATLLGGLAVTNSVASAANDKGDNGQPEMICDGYDSGKIDTTGSPPTVDYTAPDELPRRRLLREGRYDEALHRDHATAEDGHDRSPVEGLGVPLRRQLDAGV